MIARCGGPIRPQTEQGLFCHSQSSSGLSRPCGVLARGQDVRQLEELPPSLRPTACRRGRSL